MELYKGRPETNEGRLEGEIRVYDFLDAHGIEYMRTDHPPVDTMEACYEIDSILQATICKNLFLCNRQKTQFYLLMMPGDKPFKTKEITSQIGSARLSFASPEDIEKYLDIKPGAVSIMGVDERYGESGAAACGRGCFERGISGMSSVCQHVKSPCSHGRDIRKISGGSAP